MYVAHTHELSKISKINQLDLLSHVLCFGNATIKFNLREYLIFSPAKDSRIQIRGWGELRGKMLQLWVSLDYPVVAKINVLRLSIIYVLCIQKPSKL